MALPTLLLLSNIRGVLVHQVKTIEGDRDASDTRRLRVDAVRGIIEQAAHRQHRFVGGGALR